MASTGFDFGSLETDAVKADVSKLIKDLLAAFEAAVGKLF